MPLVYLGTGWLVGIGLASALHAPVEALLLAAIIPVIGLALWWKEQRARLIWLSVLFAIFGGLRFAVSVPHFDQDSLSTYNSSGEVTVEGVVDAPPDQRDTYINLRLKADRLTLPGAPASARPIEGVLLARPGRPAEFRYGDRLRVSGELTTPPEFATFSYKDFLARQGVYALIDYPRITLLERDQGSPILAAIYAFRDSADDVIKQILPEPQASLLTGILLGDDSGLPTNVQEDFRRTGTTHIIAISGYNITVIISILSAIAVRLFGRRKSFPILVMGLVIYTIMVGASASVVRAAVMGVITLWAIYLGRQAAALNSLFAAGFIMTALDPNTLFDVGFQLSFVATLGLVVYAKPFADSTQNLLTRLFGNPLARTAIGMLNDAVLVTLAAQVTTLPLLIYYFRQLSTVSLVVNPLVLPAQTGVMVFGLLALAAGLLAIPLGQIAAWTVWPFLTWTLGVIHVFAQAPWAVITLDYVSPILVAVYYAGLIGITWYLKKPKEQRPKAVKNLLTTRNLVFGGGLAILLIGVALSWRADNRLHIYALDVEGHPIFVQTPAGKQILIGGSNSPSGLLAALGGQLPFWDREVDLLVVPQAQNDQWNGLMAVLDRYDVKQIMSVEAPTDNRAGREWRTLLEQKRLPPVELQAIEVEPDVKVSFDGASTLIESQGSAVAIGLSEQAQINVIAEPIDRLPEKPQVIFAWTPVISDTRVIDLLNRGTLDLSVAPDGVSMRWLR